ncbi:histidine kinase [Terrimicrobium sacchariphilum]|uniref:Histidine kinase n=1 Tax=Terrimicrobium sacchariphilum TaxID=690879 RepID=A0A146G3Y0_TERSA|nr:histidine kinase [Terrimicrobium sacchariphilum]
MIFGTRPTEYFVGGEHLGAFFLTRDGYGVGVKLGVSFDPDRRDGLFWRLQVFGWGLTLIISVAMTSYLSLEDGLVLSLFRTAFGVGVSTYLLRPLYRGLRASGPVITPVRLFTIVAICLALGVADTITTLALADVLGVSRVMDALREVFSVSLLMRAALYAFWSILYFGILSLLDARQEQLRAIRTEAALRAGELQLLRSQVKLHFLFDSISSVLAASDDPPAVRRLTLALTDYLRFALQRRADFEPLGVELAALESYLRVEKARLEEALEYMVEVDPGAGDVLVPVSLIPPLLENAVRYGLLAPMRPLRVEIGAVVEGDTLVLSVVNSGYWVEPAESTSPGSSLANLRRRLELLYGDRASLTLTPGETSVAARISLPVVPPSTTAVPAGSVTSRSGSRSGHRAGTMPCRASPPTNLSRPSSPPFSPGCPPSSRWQ